MSSLLGLGKKQAHTDTRNLPMKQGKLDEQQENIRGDEIRTSRESPGLQ